MLACAAFSQMLVAKRAGPDASTVRKIYWFWTTLSDINMQSKDTYRVVAATRRLADGVLPAGALSGLSPIQARRGMLRTEKKTIFGGPVGGGRWDGLGSGGVACEGGDRAAE